MKPLLSLDEYPYVVRAEAQRNPGKMCRSGTVTDSNSQ